MNAATEALNTVTTHLAQRVERVGWTMARLPNGRFMATKGTSSLHFGDRAALETWLAKASTTTTATPMVGMAALVTRLAAVGLQGRYRPARGTVAVRDTDGTPLLETRSARRVEKLLAQREEVQP